MIRLTHKELLELKFWIQEHARDGYGDERLKLFMYMKVFGQIPGPKVLEIGTGPYWGLLQFVRDYVERCVAVDPLLDAFHLAGILEDRGGILSYSVPFEHWDADSEQFDSIVTCNALDHGEMGFYLLPKIWRLLKPGGRLFLHVQLRPPTELNLIHDHALNREQLEKHLGYTNLREEWIREYPKDVDGKDFPAICGVWRKPA